MERPYIWHSANVQSCLHKLALSNENKRNPHHLFLYHFPQHYPVHDLNFHPTTTAALNRCLNYKQQNPYSSHKLECLPRAEVLISPRGMNKKVRE